MKQEFRKPMVLHVKLMESNDLNICSRRTINVRQVSKMKTLTFCSMLLTASLTFLVNSSSYAQFYFSRYDSISVIEENGPLSFPWAGGLNHPQFSNIDFNMDGRNDLFVFDKSGDKISAFVMNENNQLTLAPKYREMFTDQNHEDRSRIHDWALLRDYDNDGDSDIFTYSNGGMAVYRNDGNTDTLIFTLMTGKLLSDYGNGLINIYVSPTDLMTIMDVDNDSDMDVVTFSLFGTNAEYHQNMSMETYGHADSLDYILADPCWGRFEEDPSTLGVNLNVSCKGGLGMDSIAALNALPHSGFTMLGLDIEGDGDKDLVLGIVSFNSMNLLMNEGSLTDANMTSQDLTFPQNYSNTVPINVVTFPAAFIADVNNDGKIDLLASSFAENNGNNYSGSHLYLNNGTASTPSFDFVQENFLQDNMIELGSSAYPVFFDYDNDGLKDLLVGSKGYFISSNNYSSQLAYYRNTGSATQPEFTLQDRDLLNLSQLELGNVAPTFGDLDGDGDDDMLIGIVDGTLHYFENSGGMGNPCDFSLTEPGFQGIDIGGQYSTPFLFDLDGDSILDLVIGERNGNLNYYHNDGTQQSPTFSLSESNLGGVDMRIGGLSFGYSCPFLFKVDNDIKLLVGSELGEIHLYDQITEVISGPEELSGQVGTGNAFSVEDETTPFAFSNSSSRNQYLIRSDELLDLGLLQGVIESITLQTSNGPSIEHNQFSIRMGLTNLNELNGFVDGLTTVNYLSSGTVGQGSVTYEAQTPINWDGSSNLIVEFCWFQTLGTGQNLPVQYSTTSFSSNAFARQNNFSACGIDYQGSSSKRPNMSFTVRPSFNKVGNFPVYEGERASIFASDIDDDDMFDFVIGNLAGGLAYYRGTETGLEINSVSDIGADVKLDVKLYPNPNSGVFAIETNMSVPEKVDLTVFNIQGKEIWFDQVDGDGKIIVSLPDLNAGLYFIRIGSKRGYVTKRFVLSYP